LSLDTFKCRQSLDINGQSYDYYSLPLASKNGLGDISRLPFSLKVLLENLLRNEDDATVTRDDIMAFPHWLDSTSSTQEIAYRPARVLMQDFTGVPAVVDLAAMRDAVANLGGDPKKINPLSSVDLVIDHSVQVDEYASNNAFAKNVDMEMQRNKERYEFLRWGGQTFDDFRVVPPGTGICHQVNLEHLAKVVWTKNIDGKTIAYPDTLVGTDSHTTMVNGIGVLGWGVGGIEAEAAMLGQPISMLIPEVIGFELKGELPAGITATDLVLTVTQMLRARGVVGKFVEFFGNGLTQLPLADRATISNMAPEYGATCGFFPVDEETLNYMRLSDRSDEQVALTKAYCQAQGLWHDKDSETPTFTDALSLDLSTVVPSLAGPKRPQDRVAMANLKEATTKCLEDAGKSHEKDLAFDPKNTDWSLHHGDVVIAAITSCTNTSNPSVMLAAGLVAKRAREKGLMTKPWVKTSLAPGSKVVTDYLAKAGVQADLDALGFNLVGYGCTTCIGNSGPLPAPVTESITKNDVFVCSVLSGNRNFEGRVHPLTKANWLASPPLVVAYAIAGTTCINLDTDPLGYDDNGEPVFLKDIWPTPAELQAALSAVDKNMFEREYADAFTGDETWQAIATSTSETYAWQADSTYVKNPPYFVGLEKTPGKTSDVINANVLALLGDSITTDHISPAGAIKADSPAGRYLKDKGINELSFNSYGSRRGNHEVMMRGTFANIRIRNEMVPGTEGGFTKHIPTGETMAIYDAAMRYQEAGTPLVVVAGKEYGTGSSRDWAAKGTLLLGVKAVITESYERIHRSNLIGMGVLPLQFNQGESRESLKMTGDEVISLTGLENIMPGMTVNANIKYSDGREHQTKLLCRIDTENEAEYYRNGGILQKVIRDLV